MKASKLVFALLSLAAFIVVAGFTVAAIPRKNPMPPQSPSERRFEVRGQIRALDNDGKTVRIAHEEIPGYMLAMTMPLEVRDPSLLRGLKPGDDVGFQLIVTETDSWIGRLQKISETSAAASSEATAFAEQETQRLQTGETMPDFTLTDQAGRRFRLHDVRGKAILLTFIYTRCPLPNFCPLLSQNFASLQERLQKEFPGRFQLISVSIDPKFDTPQILSEYAKRWSKDEATWKFVTGAPGEIGAVSAAFGLTVEPMGGLINHDLRTALIGPDGRLVHVWKSNVWTPYEVQRRVQEVLLEPAVSSSR